MYQYEWNNIWQAQIVLENSISSKREIWTTMCINYRKSWVESTEISDLFGGDMGRVKILMSRFFWEVFNAYGCGLPKEHIIGEKKGAKQIV